MGYYCSIVMGQSIKLKGEMSHGKDVKPAGLSLLVVKLSFFLSV
jgi:hypothetical protein